MAEIPESHADLIGAPHLAHVATTNKNGSPQVSPIWLLRGGRWIPAEIIGKIIKKSNLEIFCKIDDSIFART